MARKPIIPVRLEGETKTRWQKAADEYGGSLSEFIRAAVEEKITRAVEPDAPRVLRQPVERGRPVAGGKVFKGMDPKGGKAKK